LRMYCSRNSFWRSRNTALLIPEGSTSEYNNSSYKTVEVKKENKYLSQILENHCRLLKKIALSRLVQVKKIAAKFTRWRIYLKVAKKNLCNEKTATY
jgi:hypothetical protein